MWLRETPQTTVEQYREYLRNRFRSEVKHTERPSAWLRDITNFASGPIDRFGQPVNGKATPQSSKPKTQYELDAERHMQERRAAMKEAGIL
jgi:hypothetical protein